MAELQRMGTAEEDAMERNTWKRLVLYMAPTPGTRKTAKVEEKNVLYFLCNDVRRFPEKSLF